MLLDLSHIRTPDGEVVQGLRHHIGYQPRNGQFKHVGYIHVHEHLLTQLHKDNRRDALVSAASSIRMSTCSHSTKTTGGMRWWVLRSSA